MASSSKKYSHSEVSLHTSMEDCWVVIHGKVYDVTSFLGDHPGGVDVILQQAAFGDATIAFEEVGHSSSAISTMEGHLIGLIDSQKADTGAAGDDRQKRKESKVVEQAKANTMQKSLFDYLLPLLILGLAFGAWYYVNVHSNAKA